MRRPIRIVLALYPKKWRDRYRTELEALLEDVQPGSRDLADLAWGAIKMQMTNWGFAKFVGAFAVAGLMVGGISAFMVKSTYVSKAVVRLTGDPDVFAQAETNALSRTSLSAMIQKNDLYPQERTREPLEDILEQMRTKDIHIAVKPGESNAFQVSYSATDPRKAQAVTRLLIESLSYNLPASPVQNLEVLDPANLPKEPAAPNRFLIAALGLAGGVILGVVVAGMRKFRRQTFIYAAAFGVAGLLVTLIPSYVLVPNRYTSNSVIRIQPPDAGELVVTVLRSRIAERHLTRVGIENIRTNAKVAVIRISVTDQDQKAAQRTNQELISTAFETTVASHEVRTAEVLDNANYPLTPSAPNRYVIAVLGLGGGILCGTAARFRARS